MIHHTKEICIETFYICIETVLQYVEKLSAQTQPRSLYRQIVGIPMGTNCVPLVADLFLFCYERGFITSLSADNQADIIKAFNSTSRYFDDLLNIDNPYFEGIVN